MRHERVLISETTRLLLCDFAAGDWQRPLRRFNPVDWEEVFSGICRNGLLGLTYSYLKHHPHEDYPPAAFREWVRQASRLDVLQTALRYRQVRQVLTALNQAGLDYMVVKGPAVAYTVYPEPNWRPFNDLDLIVRESDWATVHDLLLALGFYQEVDEKNHALELPQPPPKLIPQAVPYELSYWQPELELRVEIHYDDILNAGLAARDREGFWRRARVITIEETPVKVMSLEDQLIHLCMHLHYHGYTRLNAFTEIAFIVRDHAGQLDWAQLIETARIEEAEVGVYYTLHFLDQLLGVKTPAHILTALRPDRFRRWWHDYYMPQQEVLSLAPMPRPDFSFYFLPFFKRLLPDLLVMGRRKEKLRYLVSLLAPPPAWLRHYYRLDDAQPILIHYLLHPLKLAAYYLAELTGLEGWKRWKNGRVEDGRLGD